ncbi:MAG: GNAT family N-acetyltransferase [Gammaproteobacteria bacterium]
MSSAQQRIRDAAVEEAPVLSDLALRSKALWPYSDDFIEACREELTYTPAQLEDAQMVFRVVERGGVIAAFLALDLRPSGDGEVLALFVDPDCVRQGLGDLLWREAVRIGRERSVPALRLASDPYAEPFYARMGAQKTGEIPSHSIPGRVLPLMRFALS